MSYNSKYDDLASVMVLFPSVILTSVASNGILFTARSIFNRSARCILAAIAAFSAAAEAVFCTACVRLLYAASSLSCFHPSALHLSTMELLFTPYFEANALYVAPPMYSARMAFQSTRFFSSIVLTSVPPKNKSGAAWRPPLKKEDMNMKKSNSSRCHYSTGFSYSVPH